MKKIFWPLTLFFFTALAHAAYAQDEIPNISSDTVKKVTSAIKKKLPGKAVKKQKAAEKFATQDEQPVKKKPVKKKKKKPAPPVSEYKFSQGDDEHAYKFDKRANPIVKDAKAKKKTAKKGSAKKKTPAEEKPDNTAKPKLQTTGGNASPDGDAPAIPQKELPQQPPAEEGGE